MGKVVLVFGSEHDGDDLALRVAEEVELEGILFKRCSRPEDILGYRKHDVVYVMDVVEGLDRVRFVDVGELRENRSVTAHDFDLGFYLKLMAEAGDLGKIRVVGIPKDGRLDEVRKELAMLLG